MKTDFELERDSLQDKLDYLVQDYPCEEPYLEAFVDINGTMHIIDRTMGRGYSGGSFALSDNMVDQIHYSRNFDGELYMALYNIGLGTEAAFTASLTYE
jgi:hypothetical protein